MLEKLCRVISKVHTSFPSFDRLSKVDFFLKLGFRYGLALKWLTNLHKPMRKSANCISSSNFLSVTSLDLLKARKLLVFLFLLLVTV